jgi:hypothetical protein
VSQQRLVMERTNLVDLLTLIALFAHPVRRLLVPRPSEILVVVYRMLRDIEISLPW